MANERDILKSLLLKEELELLDKIKHKILSQEQFTKEVSKVLSKAVERATKEDKNFERVLSIPIKNGVKQSFSDSKQTIIDSLLPIMGQLIRKTVTNSIKQFVTDINRTLELGLSSKSIKWRWQARKAGITFAEIVFQKTIRYQVEEIFLINKENGLLIEHVGSDNMLKDKDAISAMLTVIQDFIGDSLKESDSGLLSAEIDNSLILISSGPTVFIASVIKGSPSERLKRKFQELIENIHADFSSDLLQIDKYRNIPGLQEYLQSYLITKTRSDKVKKINWSPWILSSIILISGLFYWSYKRTKSYNKIFETIQSTPGLFLQSLERTSLGYKIIGLQDPLADVSLLQDKYIILDTKPFVSLDDKIVQARVNIALSEFKTVKAIIKKGVLTISGKVTKPYKQIIIDKLNSIIGINKIDNQLKLDEKSKINQYLAKYPDFNNQIKYILTRNKITISGSVSYEYYQLFHKQFKQMFPAFKIENNDIKIINSTKGLINFINNISINIPNINKVFQNNNAALMETINHMQSLVNRGENIQLEIIGESDCFGSKSDDFSRNRAKQIQQIFIKNGINKNNIITNIKTCATYEKHNDDLQKNVTFKIKQVAL